MEHALLLIAGALAVALCKVITNRKYREMEIRDSRFRAAGLYGGQFRSYIAAQDRLAGAIYQIEMSESIITEADMRPGDRWDMTIN